MDVWIVESGDYDERGVDLIAVTWNDAVAHLRSLHADGDWGEPERNYYAPEKPYRRVVVQQDDPRWDEAKPNVTIKVQPRDRGERTIEYEMRPTELIGTLPSDE